MKRMSRNVGGMCAYRDVGAHLRGVREVVHGHAMLHRRGVAVALRRTHLSLLALRASSLETLRHFL